MAARKELIDLAPQHKSGLVVSSPVLVAGGILGMAEALPEGLQPEELGGVVVGPLRRHPHAGPPPPRVGEVAGHFVLDVGPQNRGLNATLKRHTRHWTRLRTTVVVQLADDDLNFLGYVAARLSEQECVAGLEIVVPQRTGGWEQTAAWLQDALRQLQQQCDLPLWVKLPLGQAALLAPLAIAGGAAGLVIAQPPIGMLPARHGDNSTLFTPVADNSTASPSHTSTSLPTMTATARPLIRGMLHGPALLPQVLNALYEVRQLDLPTALIGCGGIHSVADAQQMLAAGASALQIDSALWVEPGIANYIADALR